MTSRRATTASPPRSAPGLALFPAGNHLVARSSGLDDQASVGAWQEMIPSRPGSTAPSMDRSGAQQARPLPGPLRGRAPGDGIVSSWAPSGRPRAPRGAPPTDSFPAGHAGGPAAPTAVRAPRSERSGPIPRARFAPFTRPGGDHQIRNVQARPNSTRYPPGAGSGGNRSTYPSFASSRAGYHRAGRWVGGNTRGLGSPRPVSPCPPRRARGIFRSADGRPKAW